MEWKECSSADNTEDKQEYGPKLLWKVRENKSDSTSKQYKGKDFTAVFRSSYTRHSS